MKVINIVDYRIIRTSDKWFILELKCKFLCFSWWYQPCGFSSCYMPNQEKESIDFLIKQVELYRKFEDEGN